MTSFSGRGQSICTTRARPKQNLSNQSSNIPLNLSKYQHGTMKFPLLKVFAFLLLVPIANAH
jgi:hypothetical protein